MAFRTLLRALLRNRLLLKDISHNRSVNVSKHKLGLLQGNSRGITSSRIFYSTASDKQIKIENVKEIDKGVSLTFSTTQEHKFNYVWLRDHCHCSQCYSHVTFQRSYDSNQIPLDIVPENIIINGSNLEVKWKDGHVTTFNASWLLDNHYGKPYHAFVINPEERIFWGNEIKHGMPAAVDFNQLVDNDETLYQLLKNITVYGFSVVSNTPTTKEGALTVGERIGPVKETLYGKVWELTNSAEEDIEFLDSSYLNVALPGHTDGTYFHESPGLQFFHIHQHDGEGGETLLVDGIHAAQQLRHQEPAMFEFLANTSIPASFYDPAYKSRGFNTLIRVDPVSKEIYQVRINDLDRDTLSCLQYDDVQKFYEANQKLTRILRSKSNELWFKLSPGNLLVVHNWRVLHGRSEFSGSRTLAGLYIDHDHYLSKTRLLQMKMADKRE